MFNYKLELSENLNLPLVKDRNFDLNLKLVPVLKDSVQHQQPSNFDNVPLRLSLYTSGS